MRYKNVTGIPGRENPAINIDPYRMKTLYFLMPPTTTCTYLSSISFFLIIWNRLKANDCFDEKLHHISSIAFTPFQT